MGLKLFRSTGYSTLLLPGETRVAMHPLVLAGATSLWLALPCNVALWRALAHPEAASLMRALLAALVIGGGSFALLSLLGWRRTLKAASTLLLLAGAVVACGLWLQGLPIESLWTERPRSLLPSWASFMRGQVVLLMLGLVVLPVVWIWHVPVRRLPGPVQLRANLAGVLAGGLLAFAAITAA